MPHNSSLFGLLPDGREVQLFELSSDSLTVQITNYGARIVSVRKDGVELVHGPKTLEDILADKSTYAGAICGRVANRIRGGKFTLEGKEYELMTNNPPNHLHGGREGFDSKLWHVEAINEGELVLTYQSPEGEENYPGSVYVEAIYSLMDNSLELYLEAECGDTPTIVGLTNHVYWNLNGEGTIDDHTLMINASAYTPKDDTNIPDGRILPVDGTPFDLREPALLGRMNSAANPETSNGYDHNFVLPTYSLDEDIRLAATLRGGKTGFELNLFTDSPGVQVYTGEYLPVPRGGVAMEPQNFPDAINHPHFPSPILYPGEPYLLAMAWVIQ